MSTGGPAVINPNPTGVLVVSANLALRNELIGRLDAARWKLDQAGTGAEAFEKLESIQSELLLLDPTLPDLDGDEFQVMLQAQFPQVEVIGISGQSGQPMGPGPECSPVAAEVCDVLERGGRLKTTVPVPEVPSDLAGRPREQRLPGVIGTSMAMGRVAAMVNLVARRNTTVLLSGETGTGKDLIARAIHALSTRRNNPFVVINCAAIPESLLEAELFGYVKGAFTGAVQSRIGRIYAAQGGTLFLDEIGEMPIGLQSKLLRFIEQGEVQRLGSTDNFRVDVRVIAATNAVLTDLIQERRFREDLFYRLSIFPIELPPLRERISDLPELIENFLTTLSPRHLALTPDAMDVLQKHTWPGNVRELRNVIERASILVADGREISAQQIIL
jgi:DNA-binding NtrC family response regulator